MSANMNQNTNETSEQLIVNIYNLLSTGGDTMDAAVAYMIKENLQDLEQRIWLLENENAALYERLGNDNAFELTIPFEEEDMSSGLQRQASCGLERQSSSGLQPCVLEREQYGWNQTPEWEQAMSDSRWVQKIKSMRDVEYRELCQSAGICWQFNNWHCTMPGCEKKHEKLIVDSEVEEDIDYTIIRYIQETIKCEPKFADYIKRRGYMYLGKGPSDIAERLAEAQEKWRESFSESTLYDLEESNLDDLPERENTCNVDR